MWPAIISAGLSLAGGIFARNDAKKAQRQAQYAHDMAVGKQEQQLVETNARNAQLAEQLRRSKLDVREDTTGTITETTTGGVTRYGRVANSVDVAGMVKAAEAAGFNPLTFLRNGGLAAYMQTDSYDREENDLVRTQSHNLSVHTVTKGHNAVAAAQLASPQTMQYTAAPTSNIPSMGSVVANAAAAGFNQWNADRTRQETQDFQKELLYTQLDAAQRSPYQGSRSFYVPGYTTAGSTTKTVNKPGLGGPSTPEVGDTKVTNPYGTAWGSPRVEPGVIDAEAAEQRYGDIMSNVFGLYNLYQDGMTWLTGKTAAERDKIVKDSIAKYDASQRAQKATPGTASWWSQVQNYLSGIKPPVDFLGGH